VICDEFFQAFDAIFRERHHMMFVGTSAENARIKELEREVRELR